MMIYPTFGDYVSIYTSRDLKSNWDPTPKRYQKATPLRHVLRTSWTRGMLRNSKCQKRIFLVQRISNCHEALVG